MEPPKDSGWCDKCEKARFAHDAVKVKDEHERDEKHKLDIPEPKKRS
jgi:hypothetical protein